MKEFPIADNTLANRLVYNCAMSEAFNTVITYLYKTRNIDLIESSDNVSRKFIKKTQGFISKAQSYSQKTVLEYVPEGYRGYGMLYTGDSVIVDDEAYKNDKRTLVVSYSALGEWYTPEVNRTIYEYERLIDDVCSMLALNDEDIKDKAIEFLISSEELILRHYLLAVILRTIISTRYNVLGKNMNINYGEKRFEFFA